MPFPPKGGKPMQDEEMFGAPEEDDSYLDDLMSKDMTESDDELFKESPLESALIDAGFKVSPDQLSKIQMILEEAPEAPEAEGLPPVGGKPPMPPMPPAAGPKPQKMGGVVPQGMRGSDLRM